MEYPKYLVRPSDLSIFELDESTNCYRPYEKIPIKNRPNTYPHFTYENLTLGYHFFPIEEDLNISNSLAMYEYFNNIYIRFLSWQARSDGHGGTKGGTFDKFLSTFNMELK